MRTVDAHTGIEWISYEECVRLLEQDEIGRLAVISGGAPTILPMNYRMDGDAVVFRTDPGMKLTEAPRARVAFEIDHFDRVRREGWSVVVAGRLEEVTAFDAKVLDRVKALPVEPWAGGEKAHWMRVVPDRITGRRITRPAPSPAPSD